jgi:hypothetical protein
LGALANTLGKGANIVPIFSRFSFLLFSRNFGGIFGRFYKS